MGIEKVPTEKERKIEDVRHALEKAMALSKESGRNIFVTIIDDPRRGWARRMKVTHIIDGKVLSSEGITIRFEEIEDVFVDDQVIE